MCPTSEFESTACGWYRRSGTSSRTPCGTERERSGSVPRLTTGCSSYMWPTTDRASRPVSRRTRSSGSAAPSRAEAKEEQVSASRSSPQLHPLTAGKQTSRPQSEGPTSDFAFRARSASGKLPSRLVEDRRMEIHISFGRRRRHERHVVEGRQEDAAVQRVEMDQPVELRVAPRGGLTSAARTVGTEEILDTAAETGDVPGQAVPFDRTCDTSLEPFAERDHSSESVVGENLAERGSHRSQREDVCGDRAADAADIGTLVPR